MQCFTGNTELEWQTEATVQATVFLEVLWAKSLMRWRCQLLDFDGCIALYGFLETHQMTEELLLGLFRLRLLPVSDENHGTRV